MDAFKNLVLNFFKNYFTDCFKINYKSLALFRICIGLIIIVDLVIRSTNLIAHYSDQGVFPRYAYFRYFEKFKGYFSIYFISGSPYIVAVLFIAAGIFALCYMLGYKTKLFGWLSWVFLASIHSRNILLLQGGDNFLIALLFWSLFLPIGRKWSVDSMGEKVSRKKYFISIGSIAIIVQIVTLYVSTAIFKDHPIWNEDYTAIYYALSDERYTTLLGLKLLDYPNFLKVLTFFAYYLEKYGMLLFFIPVFTNFFRLLGVFAFISFHLIGINLTMELGLFQYICATAFILFIPNSFWKKSAPKLKFIFLKFGIDGYMQKLKNIIEPYLKLDQNKTIISKFSFIYWSGQFFALVLMIYMLLWNLREIDISYGKYFPYTWNWTARVLKIDQRWSMFAPYPSTENGWFVIPARLEDGSIVDLYRDGISVDYSKPELVSDEYPSQRWRSYLIRMWSKKYNDYRPYYLKYMVNKWNESHIKSKKIKTAKLIYMLELTPKPGNKRIKEKKVVLLTI